MCSSRMLACRCLMGQLQQGACLHAYASQWLWPFCELGATPLCPLVSSLSLCCLLLGVLFVCLPGMQKALSRALRFGWWTHDGRGNIAADWRTRVHCGDLSWMKAGMLPLLDHPWDKQMRLLAIPIRLRPCDENKCCFVFAPTLRADAGKQLLW